MELYSMLWMVFIDSCNVLWLGCSLFLASALEAVLWKTPYFEPFNRPIHSGWFGANKRWRGLISLPLAHTVSVCCLQILERYLVPTSTNFILFSDFNGIEYGLIVGFVFNLAELPNSFIKRRLKIPPGDESSWVFYVIDHMDSTFGVLILWSLYFQFPLHLILVGIIAAPLLFMGATWLRKKLGLK